MERGVLFQFFEWNLPADGMLWTTLAARAGELRKIGITAVWTPPPYKGFSGENDVGYAVYDLYDLGEFDQKGSVRTKYGTKQQFIDAVARCHDVGLHVYVDTVFNHRMGGDETEPVMVEEINPDNRNQSVSQPYEIQAWSRYTFPGRGTKYSALQLNKEHFNAFGCNAAVKDDCGKIYRVHERTFSGEVDFEFGNFDYLMGADINHYHDEVRADLIHWGQWIVEETNVDGFRLDAVKHIPASFYKDWFEAVRMHLPRRELFGVGEYWSADVQDLRNYMQNIAGTMRLFDVPLHFRFHEASQKGKDYDLSKIYEGTLVADAPLMAVTFVDNHDSQPGQSLESWVMDWFKPLAYALILLRKDGYPCVFYGDYYGNNDPDHTLVSHRVLIDRMLHAREKYGYGEQHDHFDHPTCIGWIWTGDEEHPGSMAVVMSTGETGTKRMNTTRPDTTYHDVTGHIEEKITTDANGEADFPCPAGSLSVWCA